MTNHDLLARRVTDALDIAGVRTWQARTIGCASWLLHVEDTHGHAGIVRLSPFAESALRDDLRLAHAAAGWTDDQRIADIGRDSASPRPIRDVVTSVSAAFGFHPDVRDRLLLDVGRTERRAAGASTRAARKAAVERAAAATVMEGFALATNIADLDDRITAVARAAALPLAAVPRIRDYVLRMSVEQLPQRAFWTAPVPWRRRLLTAHSAFLFDRLAAVVRAAPHSEPDALRAAVHEALRDDPGDHSPRRHAWLSRHLPRVPESDTMRSDTYRALVIDHTAAADDLAIAAESLAARLRTGAGLLTRADLAVAATMARTTPPWWVAAELQRMVVDPSLAGYGRLAPDAREPFPTEADVLTTARAAR